MFRLSIFPTVPKKKLMLIAAPESVDAWDQGEDEIFWLVNREADHAVHLNMHGFWVKLPLSNYVTPAFYGPDEVPFVSSLLAHIANIDELAIEMGFFAMMAAAGVPDDHDAPDGVEMAIEMNGASPSLVAPVTAFEQDHVLEFDVLDMLPASGDWDMVGSVKNMS